MIKYATPDAAESSAGDDFHILWTITKSLKLINFDTLGLKAISVENLSSDDNSWLNSSKGMSLGVDLTEYYGGINFNDASKVIVSQLKYSTRTPDKEWTAAQICTSRKGGSEGSVVDRLASFFIGVAAKVDRDLMLNKLSIRLVSNRPVASKLTGPISAVQLYSSKHPSKKLALTDITGLTISQLKELKRLETASKLTGFQFIDFINVLDFSACNQGSRFELEQKIVKAISTLTAFKSSAEYTFLHKLVWDKMMPEQRDLNTISLPDVLLAFNLPDIAAMFPVKNEINSPAKLVPREQIEDILEVILKDENPLICIHGGAGIGKSTLINMIPPELPEHSVSVVFDCYGGGTYLDPEDRRHKHSAGIIQICNELALKVGTDFLLSPQGSDEFYLRQLKIRIEAATAVIRSLNPQALLVIILDAADNSVTAAEFYVGNPFVKDLVKMTFTTGCRVVVSSRTERINTLELPEDAQKIPILPFTFEESKKFLVGYYNDLSDAQIKDFQKLTKSVPRVMAYAMQLPGKNLTEKMQPLRPNGKTLEQIFKLRVREAERKSSKKDVSAFLKNLIALPRPVPYSFVKSATGLSDENLDDIKIDLWPEIIDHDQQFMFRDEDFETFLRKTYTIEHKDFVKIASSLLTQADCNEYASAHLANFLNKSNQHSVLKSIVIERKHLSYPLDPVKNKEVFIERTRLAMRNASIDFHPQDFVKLLMVSAEAAKSNKVLEETLLNKPDLAAKYGNLQTNKKIYFQSGNPGWFGRVHYRNAAVYSRDKETWDLARQHLQKAKEWVIYRKRLSEEELESFELNAGDLAYGAEAILHLSGPDEAVTWIKSWKPKNALYHVVGTLIENLIKFDDTKVMSNWLRRHSDTLRIDLKLLIIRLYFENGLKLPFEIPMVLNQINLLKRTPMVEGSDLMPSIVAFCEFGLKYGLDYLQIRPFLELVNLKLPEYPPSFYNTDRLELIHLDLLLRKGIIQHLFEAASYSNKDFYSKTLQDNFASKDLKVKERAEDQVKRFERILGHLLPAYEIRGNYLFGKLSAKQQTEKVEKRIKAIADDWELKYYQRHDAPELQRFILLKLLDIAFYQTKDNLVNLILEKVGKGELTNIKMLLSICERLSNKKHFKPHIVVILKQTENYIEEAKLSGQELIEHYTRAAVTGSHCSMETGKYYFDKMVSAAEEIDFEAFSQIRSIEDFTCDSSPMRNPKLAVKFMRYAEYCAERMRSWDGFPWQSVVPTLTKIDIATAFAAVCQWDHRYVKTRSKHYIELISAALEQDYIAPEIGVAMLAMNRYYYDDLQSIYKNIFHKIDVKGDHELKNEALNQIIRDIQLNRPSRGNTGFIREFFELFENGRYTDREIIIKFKGYIDGLEQVIEQSERQESPEPIKNTKTNQYNTFIREQNIIDTNFFNTVIKAIRESQDNRYIYFDDLVESIAATAKIEHRQVYLDAFVEVKEVGVSYYDFTDGLKIFLEKWNGDAQVNSWKTTAFPKIVKKWFPTFFDDDYFRYESLKKIALILGTDESELAMTLIKLIPESLDEFSSSVLYQMLQIVRPLLNNEDRGITLTWILERWVTRVPEDYAVVSDQHNVLNSKDSGVVIAYFIRYNLGHPKKRVRWITAHILRRMALFKNTAIIQILLEVQGEKHCHPFQDNDYPFYWISAKLYLWVTLERISKESPDVLLQFSSYFLAEIRNKKLPHAQIRFFARSAALALEQFHPGTYTDTEINEIKLCQASKLEPIQKPRNGFPKEGKSDGLKFKFDAMDTMQYWFQPIGKLFHVGQYHVAAIADKYITEHWGYIGDPREDNKVQTSDYHDSSHRHGSEPRVETLQSYYEYHAMFCTATELLETKPLLVDDDSWRETWDEWLKGWGLCWENFWLADLNDPVPMEKKYWVNDRSGNAEWEWGIQPVDFDELIGLENSDEITVHLGTTIHIGKDHEDISLRSGLVNPLTSRALLRTFQTRSADDNYISTETDPDYEDDENAQNFDLSAFTIARWLSDEKTDREGIDDNDPLYKKLSPIRTRPGKLFKEWSGFKASADFRYCYREDEGIENWLTHFETWSDFDEDSNHSAFSSNGARLKIKRTVLKDFLKDVEKDLIVMVDIKRYLERKEYGKYYPAYTRIYLFRADGRIETLEGNYRTW